MELLIVTAVSSYEDDIKKLLKKTGVMAYSHMNVNGYKELPPEEQEGNWFATSVGEHRSALFYAFVDETKVDGVLQAMTDFNNRQDSESHIHAVVVDVKKSSN